MFMKLLFGVQNSPQRKLCVALAILLTVIGVLVIFVQGSQTGASGVLLGVSFTLLGLAAIAVLSRVFAARDEKAATQAQLDRLPGRYNDHVLKNIVDNAPHDPNERLGSVTGQLSRDEIQETIENVRGDS